ncbi:MAG: asparagine synthase-related protein [Alphaproteobacteria bacterium]
MASPSPTPVASRPSPRLLLDGAAGWHARDLGPFTLRWTGDAAAALSVARSAIAAGCDPMATGRALAAADGHFALVLQGRAATIASVDICRSTPLFYATPGAAEAIVGADARAVRDAAALADRAPAAVLEFAMAGYVTGGDTTVRGLHQLQAGELLHIGPDGMARAHRWFDYVPQAPDTRADGALRRALLDALDAATDRAIARADGRPVWVAVSGGLDSRLVLAKLRERGCPNLRAFSYGLPGNVDAVAGKAVAAALDVPWVFAPADGRAARRFFASPQRRDFWRQADGLASIPNFQDLQPLRDLLADRRLPREAVIVNGQTGDFISGGHITKTLPHGTTGADNVAAAIIAKHFALWRSLMTADNRATVAARLAVGALADAAEPLDWPAAAAIAERWEYAERQAKYVVNGQRVYDYLGLGWALPLWDPAIVRFFRDVPLAAKLGQRLYREALAEWDYRGLFRDFRRAPHSWPGAARLLLPAEAAVRRLFGARAHARVHRYTRWFGHYGHQYREMTLPVFLRTAHDARNLLSLHVRTWLAEEGVACSPFTARGLP